jgi:hypothetical protein
MVLVCWDTFHELTLNGVQVAAQIKLGNSLASKQGDAKRKDGLIKAGAAMSKLMGLMVASIREGGTCDSITHKQVEHDSNFFFPLSVDKDPKNLEKFAGFLREAIAMNRGTIVDAFGLQDDLNAVTEELNMNIAQLEKVLFTHSLLPWSILTKPQAYDHGTAAQLATALQKVEGGVAQQAFIAKIIAAKESDPERIHQMTEAIEELEGITKQLGPTLKQAKLHPNDAVASAKAQAALVRYFNNLSRYFFVYFIYICYINLNDLLSKYKLERWSASSGSSGIRRYRGNG